MSYEYKPVETSEKAIQEIAELLRLVFPKTKKYSDTFINWQYVKNPNGKVRGYNAYENGQLVAHYAMIPIVADVFGKHEKGFLSLNTATHPNHQGKKLFTTLAEMTYKLAAAEGGGFVVGVGNANSTPGFVNKLGFQLVGTLDAKLGFGKVPPSKRQDGIQFIQSWNKELVQWKLANPKAAYKIKDNVIFSVTDKMGIEAVLMNFSTFYSLPDNNASLGYRPITLWLGIDSSIDWSRAKYFNLPNGLRPSPLNLIFKDLTSANRKLEKDKVRFNAFDFDAY